MTYVLKNNHLNINLIIDLNNSINKFMYLSKLNSKLPRTPFILKGGYLKIT